MLIIIIIIMAITLISLLRDFYIGHHISCAYTNAIRTTEEEETNRKAKLACGNICEHGHNAETWL